MRAEPRIATVVGARPQFIKMAPFSLALKERGLREISIHTGQHYDANLSAVFFEQLGIRPPDHRLEVGSGPHGEQTGRMLEAIERVFLAEEPDWVVVIGDTNSTLAGALCAAKLHIPLAHIEAGLRSHNRLMPEEVNRICADHLSERLYYATQAAAENLVREGLLERGRRLGDVSFDAFRLFSKIETGDDPALNGIGADDPFVLLTLHRAENTDDEERLGRIWDLLHSMEWPVVFPAHPRTAGALRKAGLEAGPQLRLIAPTGYPAMLRLLSRCALLLTDSGGLQKEAYFAGVPCVTLRGETEWVETVETGWNRLLDPAGPLHLDARAESARRGRSIDAYGDGRAAQRMVADLIDAP